MTTTDKAMTKSQLDLAQEEYDRSLARFEKAQAAARAAAEAAEQRRAAALQQFDEQTAADLDEAALDLEIEQARRELTAAVLADPVWSAVVRVNRAERARVLRFDRHDTARNRLYGEDRPLRGGAHLITLAELLQLTIDEGERLSADEAAAFDQARIDAGDAAARQIPATKVGRG